MRKKIFGIVKKILPIFLFFLCAGSIFAQTYEINEITQNIFMLNSLLKLVYVLLWPLLALSGLMLDNSMVYGTFLGFDTILYKLWAIMRNFANFILAFMLLAQLFKILFGKEGGNKVFDILKKGLLAGILINLSWFLVGALIDVSNILTVAVGDMPIQAVKEVEDVPILGINLFMNLNDETNGGRDFEMSYNFAKECTSSKKKWKDIIFSGDKLVKKNICVNGGQVYIFSSSGNDGSIMSKEDYTNYIATIKNSLTIKSGENSDKIINLLKEGKIFPIVSTDWLSEDFVEENKKLVNMLLAGESNASKLGSFFLVNAVKKGLQGANSVGNINDKLNSHLGSLVTLFNSFLTTVQFNDIYIQTTTIFNYWFKALIKILFALALIIPLLGMAWVLFLRVFKLWIYIILSPILFVLWVFQKKLGDSVKLIPQSFGEFMAIVFAPVMIVFSLSLSIVIMTAMGALGNINFDNLSFENGDIFSSLASILGGGFEQILIGLLGIIIMWTLFSVAIKSTKVIEKRTFDTKWLMNALGSMPVIKIGGKGVGIKSLTTIPGTASNTYFSQLRSEQQTRVSNDILSRFEGKEDKPKKEE